MAFIIMLIVTVAFVLILVTLKTQEKHIREDGANYEEYVYKRDLRQNKNEQIAAIVAYVLAMIIIIAVAIAIAHTKA